ncbi:transporter substrate-binding domain-containing protein [Streptococcus sp. 121]|uniref:transporter substrate-binding domain-containing protein n=1 Tax=Streptococcus sp. 121 TaxID=2797637 RepID=UPI0018F08BAE|nr:transporter substrate-binding domain-containing protein [Streptococcus sp. 121]MBJ6745617.1 transporter substrate-binding domain-containing protein [Streptococcus sp. 121]
MQLKTVLKGVGILALGLALTACGSSSAGSTPEAIKEKGKLVVATSPDYAPFEFQTLIDGKNQVVGADISLAQDIADELGVELEVSTMSFDNVLTSVAGGKADLALAGLSKTPEREEVVTFSDSYYENGRVLLVRAEDKESLKDLESFKGKKVAAQKGTLEEQLAKEQVASAELVSLQAMGEAINELVAGKVDAVAIDEAVALGYVSQNNKLAISEAALKTQETVGTAVAMQKDNKELQEVVNKVIAKVKKDGSYDKYLEEASKYTVVEE